MSAKKSLITWVLSWDVTNIGYIESGTNDVSINPSWRRSPMSPQKAHKMHWYSHGLYKSMETLPSSMVNDLGAQVLEKNAGSLVVRVAQSQSSTSLQEDRIVTLPRTKIVTPWQIDIEL